MEAFVSLELHLDYQMDANLQQIQEIFLLDHLISGQQRKLKFIN
jgi:hypothetical protein